MVDIHDEYGATVIEAPLGTDVQDLIGRAVARVKAQTGMRVRVTTWPCPGDKLLLTGIWAIPEVSDGTSHT